MSSSHKSSGGQKVQKVMVQPINLIFRFLQNNLIFRFLQNKSKVQVWLYENNDNRIEGRIIGFDEYMNLVLDDAEDLDMKTHARKPLGRILMKGENITLLMNAQEESANGD